MAKKRKKPSQFRELISMSVPNFYDFNFDVEDFCGYWREKKLVCPFIKADREPNRLFKHIANFDPQNCMWICKWFVKPNLPYYSKRAPDRRVQHER